MPSMDAQQVFLALSRPPSFFVSLVLSFENLPVVCSDDRDSGLEDPQRLEVGVH